MAILSVVVDQAEIPPAVIPASVSVQLDIEAQEFENVIAARRAARQLLQATGRRRVYVWLQNHTWACIRNAWKASLALPHHDLWLRYEEVHGNYVVLVGAEDDFCCRRCGRITMSHQGYSLQELCMECAGE